MNPIAISTGSTVIYWSAVVIALGIAAGFALSYSLYISHGGRSAAMWLLLPLALLFSVPLCRAIHWYCHLEQYTSFIRAITDYSTGSYCLPGALLGTFLAALVVRGLGLTGNMARLLDGQETFWNADIDFMPNSEMWYYRDDSILVVAWQEAIEGRGCSFVEVKLADGSQLRRKISGDSYRAAGLKTATELAAEDNAVMAVSGDFYVRRSIGIGVYGGELQYFSPIAVHTCMFTSGGDMLLLRPGDIQTWEDAEKFISDNDVEFSVNFGPILVENGELQDLSSGYVYGEVDSKYSRCAIGQRGELHYLIMTVCYEQNYGTCTASTEARFMHDKGVDTAYALDGGHTATIAMNGSAYNRPDWGWQNAISDVICFASAEYD